MDKICYTYRVAVRPFPFKGKEHFMGKNLKGKDCGKGIYQRKDGLYSARFVDKTGKRHEKYFQTIPEARNWMEEAKYADKHEEVFVATETTVDQWFSFWIENIVGDLAPNTLRNYRERYSKNIQPVIGRMAIANVKPMHCKQDLIRMDADYAGSTIRQAYIAMGTLFKAAKMNDLIARHPMDGVRFTKPVRAVDDIKFLTCDDQQRFLEVAQRSHNYNQYALILETGLRTGEMMGLTWDAIDFEKRTLTVNKTLEFRHAQKYWRAGPPKTQQSYRTIPLTNRAYDILKSIWDSRDNRKESPLLSQTHAGLPPDGHCPSVPAQPAPESGVRFHRTVPLRDNSLTSLPEAVNAPAFPY